MENSYGNSKATLTRILEVALANKRASKDLQGMVGIKGAFVVNAAGDTVVSTVGTGFIVNPTATAGAFTIIPNEAFSYYLGASGMVFTPKATAANADAFELDFSSTVAASTSAVVCRIVSKVAPYAVAAPGGAGAVITFEIKGIYSDSIDNIE